MTRPIGFPTTINDESITDWLASLSQLNTVNAATSLNDGINQFRKTHHKHDLYYDCLLKILPASLLLSSTLIDSLEHDRMDRSTIKLAKLSLLIPRNLALAFLTEFKKPGNTPEMSASAAYYFLQLMGHYLLLSVSCRFLPSEKLWIHSGEIFEIADDKNLLSIPVASKHTEFRELNCIKDVIKRNVMFAVCSMQRISRQDVRPLYLLCHQYSRYIQIVQENSTPCTYYWPYLESFPRIKRQLNQRLQQYHCGLNFDELLIKLPDYNRLADKISEPLYHQVKLTFTAFKKPLNDSIPAAPKIQRILSGLPAIHEFLTERQKLNRINQLGGLAPDSNRINKMNLEPMAHEKNHLTFTESFLNQAEQTEELVAGHTIKILRTQNSQYLNIESHKLNFETGDLVLLFDKKMNLTLGLIKQQKLATTHESTQLLVEKITQMITPVTMVHKHGEWAGLLSHDTHQRTSIILPYQRLQSGEQLVTTDAQKLNLGCVLSYSTSFIQYQLFH